MVLPGVLKRVYWQLLAHGTLVTAYARGLLTLIQVAGGVYNSQNFE
jgi:hypothetical protein